MKTLWELVNEPDNDHHFSCWKDGLEKQDWECWKWQGWKDEFDEHQKLFEAELRESIAQDIMIQIEAPTDISSDWYAATKRTKMAAASIAKGAE